jgi:hypothetical protein
MDMMFSSSVASEDRRQIYEILKYVHSRPKADQSIYLSCTILVDGMTL